MLGYFPILVKSSKERFLNYAYHDLFVLDILIWLFRVLLYYLSFIQFMINISIYEDILASYISILDISLKIIERSQFIYAYPTF